MMSLIRWTVSLLRGKTGICGCQTRVLQVRSGSAGPGGLSVATGGSGEGAGLILQSQSTDIYQNLALEDWIEANMDLQQHSVLLLWRNRPAVVIGRHQNPWTECNLCAMREAGIPLARRRSGGGTVFHDLGNLNLTFFTSKKAYNRRRNLQVVTDALRRLQPELDVQATDRFDIMLNRQYKISGSASRLSRTSSYHHCTLLHSADHSTLSAVLRPSCSHIHSNATPSIPASVTNLLDHAPSLKWEVLLDALGDQFNKEFGFGATATLVDPADESAFPGLSRMETVLRGWDWTFGKTPKFSVRTCLDLTDDRLLAQSSAHLHMDVKNGMIETCELDVPVDWLPQWLSGELSSMLVGGRFCPHETAAAAAALLRSHGGKLQSRFHNLCETVLSVMG
ncbi:hypothetical protein LDENG_00219710 [Lucifuga dentata]|nr:hypothetical protein LDENG_00219710 [Lucifuga dentata]